MKINLITLIPLIILLISCAGSAKPAESSGGMTLDQALHEAAKRIDERIAAGSKIAPLNFNSPHDKFSGYVLDELTANLVESRKLTIVDRKEVDLIRGEFDFQFSGEVGDDSMQELGRMLGAQAIISGSVTDMGDFYRIVIRVLNVQNASVEVQYRANIENDRIVKALMVGGRIERTASIPRKAATAQTSVTPATAPVPFATLTPVVTPAPTPPPITYKVGDTGPAGGLIFYDKGNNSGGWRYLEAAPADVVGKLYAISENFTIEAQRALGTGKENTQAIMVQANNRGGGFGWAAQACDVLEVNGYSDWFLPSKDELHYMYGNLHMRNIGSFNTDWYWSSTFEYHYNRYFHWWAENFSNGEQAHYIGTRGENPGYSGEPRQFRIRACRRF